MLLAQRATSAAYSGELLRARPVVQLSRVCVSVLDVDPVCVAV
jgi:hypothetical protein